jgi:hypothetical protein
MGMQLINFKNEKMKKMIFAISIMFLSTYAKADQLAWVTKEQAEKTTAFLKENGVTEAILWCGCCSNEPKKKIKINNYFSRYAGTQENIKYYEIILVGTLDDGNKFSKAVDLAYVFLRVGSQAKCFGKLLNFECDPCSLPFAWNSIRRYPNVPTVIQSDSGVIMRDTTSIRTIERPMRRYRRG